MAHNILIRETPGHTAVKCASGVRIMARASGVELKSRVVSMKTWKILESMSDKEFDGSCVLELGIGVFQKKGKSVKRFKSYQ